MSTHDPAYPGDIDSDPLRQATSFVYYNFEFAADSTIVSATDATGVVQAFTAGWCPEGGSRLVAFQKMLAESKRSARTWARRHLQQAISFAATYHPVIGIVGSAACRKFLRLYRRLGNPFELAPAVADLVMIYPPG